MNISKRGAAAAAVVAGLVPFLAGPASAEETRTVVELFTSQGCYSCPPAERFLGELAQREDVIALEFHVDYWDDLVYGRAGKWKDVFSKPAHTARQRAYNIAIRRKGAVYTPQIVIDGRFEVVGSHRRATFKAIRKAAADRRHRLDVTISTRPGGGLSVAVDGAAPNQARIWLVHFKQAETTEVSAGENKGKTLSSRHIVTDLRAIGRWQGRATKVNLPSLTLSPNQGCAVIVQNAKPGPILGSAVCPRTTS